MTSSFSFVARFLQCELNGQDGTLTRMGEFPAASEEHISFCSRQIEMVPKISFRSLVISSPNMTSTLLEKGYSVIESDYPKYDYARVYHKLFAPSNISQREPGSCVDKEAFIGENVSIGRSTEIGAEVVVGDNCQIGSNVIFVGRVTVGNSVRIRNNVVIGDDPFTYGFGPEGRTLRFPAFGGVSISGNCDIGNGVIISCGAFTDTTLGNDVHINDLSNLGQGVKVGDRSLIMANCALSGRVVVGVDCWIGVNATLRQGVHIGDKALIGAGAVVLNNIPEGVQAYGVPARNMGPRT